MTQYLTFCLKEEVFAVPISRVREVIEFSRVTKMPLTPEFISGVINLRGDVVPVIDMGVKFEMGAVERTVDTCVIILEIDIDGSPSLLGALVDSVQAVVHLSEEDTNPPPKLANRLKLEYIEGMGRIDDDFIILLNLDSVFSEEELNLVNESRVNNDSEG